MVALRDPIKKQGLIILDYKAYKGYKHMIYFVALRRRSIYFTKSIFVE
jgi:hypothetical protein